MNWWQRLRNRWRLEDQLDAELRFHFDLLVRDYMDEGASEREARRRARAEFGGVDEIKDACRDARGMRWAHDIARDVRFSARLVARDRSVTFVAVLALALGIGVNTAMFTVVDAVCLRGLPIAAADRVADISQQDQTHPQLRLSLRQFEELEASRPPALAGISAYTSRPATLTDDRTAAARVVVAYVSSSAFGTIGESPAIGRDFRASDERKGTAPVAILSAATWRARYDASPGIIGQTVRINGTRVTVIAVMPDADRFPNDADVWEPLSEAALTPDARVLTAYGRLSSGATLQQAQDGIAAVLSRVPMPAAPASVRTVVVPINTRYRGDLSNPAWVAFITVGLLLVAIACSNVANVLLARGVSRQQEIAMRVSLGATRGRIVRQLLIESLMLACLGGVGALGVSAAGLRALDAATPPGGLGYWVTLTMDARIGVVLAVVCLGTALLFGLAPVWQLSRTDLASVGRNTSRPVSRDRASARVTWALLTCQLALAVLLVSQIVGSLQAFAELRAHEPSIDAAHILTFAVALPHEEYATPDQREAFFSSLADRLRGRHAASISVANALPSDRGVPRRVVPVDETLSPATPPVFSFDVDDSYFRTLGIDLAAGRSFVRGSASDAETSVIVNQRFADLYFHGASVVGRRVRVEREIRTIVGVVPSIRSQMAVEPPPLVFLPLQPSDAASAVILVRGAPEVVPSLGQAIREEVRDLAADVPVMNLMTLEEATWKAGWLTRESTGIITTVAMVAFFLATIGLMGLTAYAVGRRRREFGIRLAIGATPSHVVFLTLRRVLLQVLLGVACGSLLSIGWDRVFGAAIRTSFTVIGENLALTALLLTIVMMAAAAWPARHAAHIDPLLTLKSE